MISPLVIASAGCTALGAYNVARFTVSYLAKRKKQAREWRDLQTKINFVVTHGEKVYNAVKAASPEQRAAKVKELVGKLQGVLQDAPAEV